MLQLNAAFLFVLLNIVEVCNGGITSSFVRKPHASEDMPLSAFPPPHGYNAPEQVEALPVNLSLGETSPKTLKLLLSKLKKFSIQSYELLIAFNLDPFVNFSR